MRERPRPLSVLFAFLLAGCSAPSPPSLTSQPSTPPVAVQPDTPIPVVTPELSATPFPFPEGADVVEPVAGWEQKVARLQHEGGIVYLGAGEFALPTMLFQTKVHWVGAGPGITRVVSTNSRAAVLLASPEAKFEQIGFIHQSDKPANVVAATAGQASFDHCEFSGSLGEEQSAAGILADGTSIVTVSHCRFTKNQSALRAIGSSRLQMSHCESDGTQGCGISVSDGAQASISNCTFQHSGYAAIYLQGSKNLQVSGCTISDCEREGIVVAEKTVALIKANHISKAVNGIEVHGSPTLVGNTCENCKIGIYYTENAAGTATDNLCQGNSLHGIEIGGTTSPVLKKNRCLSNQGGGISVYQNAAPDIEDNDLKNNRQGGILIEDPARPKLGTNRFDQNAGVNNIVRVSR